MKKNITAIIVIIMAVLALMYAEYRYIMVNQCPYITEDNTVYIEIFGQVDSYYAEPLTE